MIYPLILSTLLFHISGGAWIKNLNIGVKSGSPGIIPCVYNTKYKENHKYGCKGYFWSSCSKLYAKETINKFAVTDYPDQSIFTVQWENLQTEDSGYYWCAVEIGDHSIMDDSYYLYLTVQSAPDVSVMNSSVSGHEGDGVSVQCFYSSGYQNELKQWCRYKGKRCYTEGRTHTSQNSSVLISDDWRSRSFTVHMAGLRLTDSGWYLCSVGDLQVPVQLTVTQHKSKVTNIPATTPSDSQTERSTTQPSTKTIATSVNKVTNTALITDPGSETHIDKTHPSLIAASETINTEKHNNNEQDRFYGILIMCCVVMLVLLLLVTLVAVVTRRPRTKSERSRIREDEHFNTTNNTTSSENRMTSTSPADADSPDDYSVIYSSVVTTRKTPLSSADPDTDVIYSSVKKPRKA